MKEITVTEFDWSGDKTNEYMVTMSIQSWNKFLCARCKIYMYII